MRDICAAYTISSKNEKVFQGERALFLGSKRLFERAGGARRKKVMNCKALVAASLMSVLLTSSAFAQCVECALYPNRDTYTGQETPAGKMGLMRPNGAAGSTNSGSNANSAYAGLRSSYMQSGTRGAASTAHHHSKTHQQN
jgi:hypothetical protein